jgi:dTMP kinase
MLVQLPVHDTQKAGKSLFICFIGIDGSGKTTLAKRLTSILESRGIQVKYVWGAHDLIILRPFIAVFNLLLGHRKVNLKNYGKYHKSVKSLLQSGFLASTYKSSILLEYFLEIFFKIRMPLRLGKNIVSDRYVYDTIVNLAVNLGYSPEDFLLMLRKFMPIFPKPDLTFLVDVPEEIAYQRKKDIPSLDYLKYRRKLYSVIENEYELPRLDGTASLGEQKHLICNSLMKICP